MKILIIGGDAAGMSAASQVKRRQKDWQVTVLEKGRFTSYASCGIPYYLAGDVEDFDDLVVVTPEQFREKRGIDVRMGWEATSIDIQEKVVTARTDRGSLEALPYDRLLIATGASPIVPSWPGVDLDGVTAVRNLEDAARLEQWLERGPRRAVVVGAGYVGLEMAEALRRRNLEVTVVEKLAGVMGGAEAELTQMVRDEAERQGIHLLLETTVQGFRGSDGRLRTVETDGGSLPADLAVVSLGVRPNSALARDAGIGLGVSGAIHVDPSQRTDAEDVFAAGDCCEAHHLVLGRPDYFPLALTANRQGRVAGANSAGGHEHFPGIAGSCVTRLFDLTIARTGIDEATAGSEGIAFGTVTAVAPSKAHYFPGHDPLWVKLVFRSDNHKLLGAWLVGRDPSAGKRADVLAVALSNGMSIEQIADLDLTYAPPFAPVWDPVLQAANKAKYRLASEPSTG
jgi:NADPH-dependent 2,4-dienoyl-CoA reductase/sulfur reductase-like enzyme